jgi:hypothetical protein
MFGLGLIRNHIKNELLVDRIVVLKVCLAFVQATKMERQVVLVAGPGRFVARDTVMRLGIEQ